MTLLLGMFSIICLFGIFLVSYFWSGGWDAVAYVFGLFVASASFAFVSILSGGSQLIKMKKEPEKHKGK